MIKSIIFSNSFIRELTSVKINFGDLTLSKTSYKIWILLRYYNVE